jgi:beta-glucanase (GH16 family)
MKHPFVGLVSLLLVACAAAPPQQLPAAASARPAAAAPVLRVPAAYALVWSDEFSNDGLPDSRRWGHDTGMNKSGWHNRELQYYSAARAENAEVRGGRLIIQARKESMSQASDWGRQRYTSARLLTKGLAEWTYGFFEIRAQLPCGKGSWPAIWMLNSALQWPQGGELDIMEHVGRQPGRVLSTVHTAAAHGNGKGDTTFLKDACTAFHNYQMHWTPQQLRFGVDGRVHFVYNNAGTGKDQWPFDAPQFLILNIAVGGDLGGAVDETAFPLRMEIDHVRVYQSLPPSK